MASATAIDYPRLTRELALDPDAIARTVALLDDGNTVPFITRYRRDQTGGLDEQQIAAVRDSVTRLRQLDERKQTILRSIESQNKLTDELRREIEHADSVKRLEDLYLPFRPKKQSLATQAREQGLGPLADEILVAAKECADLDAPGRRLCEYRQGRCRRGAAHCSAPGTSWPKSSANGPICGNAFARSIARAAGCSAPKSSMTRRRIGSTTTTSISARRCTTFRRIACLAINRGERANVLRVKIEVDELAIEQLALELLVPPEHPHKDFLIGCVHDALTRLRAAEPGARDSS